MRIMYIQRMHKEQDVMTTINFRVDENLKNQANALFEDLGLDMTTALTLFLRQSVSHGGIPFAIQKPRWAVSSKEELVAKLNEAEKSLQKGETVSHDDFWNGMRVKYGQEL